MGYRKAIAREKAFKRHLRTLGMRGASEYQQWCERNNIDGKLHKQPDARRFERDAAKSGRRTPPTIQPRGQQRSAYQTLKSIATSPGADEMSEARLRRLFEDFERDARQLLHLTLDHGELKKLALHVHGNGMRLHSLTPIHRSLCESAGNTNIEGIFLVSLHRKDWLRPLHDWPAEAQDDSGLFGSLLRHLFVRYDDMPKFFDAVWFSGLKPTASTQRAWYLQVGKGESIRSCAPPIALTKRMAHYFMQAPEASSVEEALRWGQVMGSSGNVGLARAVCRTRIGQDLSHAEYWASVIQWLGAQPDIQPAHVGPIVDFMHHWRWEREEAARTHGVQPVSPESILKGRSLQTLLRQVNAWHCHLAADHLGVLNRWRPSGFEPFERSEGESPSAARWTIRELLSNFALAAEGRSLNHCVATYERTCEIGQSSIWTLERSSSMGMSKHLTIQVCNAKRSICQARGYSNRMPSSQEMAILTAWAAAARLSLDI